MVRTVPLTDAAGMQPVAPSATTASATTATMVRRPVRCLGRGGSATLADGSGSVAGSPR